MDKSCGLANSTDWKKVDTKDGITVSRKSFSDQMYAVIKVGSIFILVKNPKISHEKQTNEIGTYYYYYYYYYTFLVMKPRMPQKHT